LRRLRGGCVVRFRHSCRRGFRGTVLAGRFGQGHPPGHGPILGTDGGVWRSPHVGTIHRAVRREGPGPLDRREELVLRLRRDPPCRRVLHLHLEAGPEDLAGVAVTGRRSFTFNTGGLRSANRIPGRTATRWRRGRRSSSGSTHRPRRHR
jgi:hypothetical protein